MPARYQPETPTGCRSRVGVVRLDDGQPHGIVQEFQFVMAVTKRPTAGVRGTTTAATFIAALNAQVEPLAYMPRHQSMARLLPAGGAAVK